MHYVNYAPRVAGRGPKGGPREPQGCRYSLHVFILSEHGAVVLTAAVIRAQAAAQAVRALRVLRLGRGVSRRRAGQAGSGRGGAAVVLVALLGSLLQAEGVVNDGGRADGPAHFQLGGTPLRWTPG